MGDWDHKMGQLPAPKMAILSRGPSLLPLGWRVGLNLGVRKGAKSAGLMVGIILSILQ